MGGTLIKEPQSSIPSKVIPPTVKTQIDESKNTQNNKVKHEDHFIRNMNKKRNLNSIKQSVKDLTFGYIRDIRQLFAMENSYYNIPKEIIYFILFYYCENMKFDVKNHGDALTFLNETTVCSKGNFEDAICIFGDEITSKDCNIFRLHIKWVNCTGQLFIGCIISSFKEFKEIALWNNYLSHLMYKDHIMSIVINSKDYSKDYHRFYLYDKNNEGIEFGKIIEDLKNNDIFIMEFNFNKNKFILYHNNSMVDEIDFYHKRIIPIFSLWYGGGSDNNNNNNNTTKIEITDWEFA